MLLSFIFVAQCPDQFKREFSSCFKLLNARFISKGPNLMNNVTN